MENKRTEEHTPELEYIRRLYENVVDWYKNAEVKAQIILTLDGLFITFVANTLLKDTESISKFPWYSLVLLSLMCATLAVSLYHAIRCIWSRIYNSRELEQFLQEADVNRSSFDTYAPAVCWFFQSVASLDKTEFEKRMRSLRPNFEVDAMSSQIYYLSRNVVSKHRYVNLGFTFTAITFLLFLATGMSLLIPSLLI